MIHAWAAAAIVGLGATLRFQGLDWDHGLMLNPDERNIAAGAAGLAFPDALVPQFHAYNGLAVYLPRLAAEALEPLTGRDGADPAAIVEAGRMVSAALSSLAVAVLWRAAQAALGAGAGLLAAALAATAPGLVQWAHFATTESGLVLCLAVQILLAVRYTAEEMTLTRFAVLSGLTLGLGAGLKTTALAFALVPVAAVALAELRVGRLGAIVAAGTVSAVLALTCLVATTPQLVADPGAWLATMRFEADVVSGAADVFWTYQFEGAVAGLFEASQLPWLLGPATAALGLAGVAAALHGLWRRQPMALRLAPATVAGLAYAAIVLTWHAKFVRYLAPLVPVLILHAAYLWQGFATPRWRAGLAGLLVAITAAAGLTQAALYQRDDPRLAAWHWLAPQLAAGDRLAVEPVDVGPPYPQPAVAGLEVAVLPLLDPAAPVKTAAVADILAGADWLIVASRRHHQVLPRLTRFADMCAYYRALWAGELGYAVRATFRRWPALPAALDPTREAEETFTVFDAPVVMVLANAGRLDAARIAAAIAARDEECFSGR